MSCPILSPDRWRRLLENRLMSGESRELLEHLTAECPACERLFETMDDATEGRMRLLLRAMTGTRQAPVAAESREVFRAVMRRVDEARTARSASPWRRWFGPLLTGTSAAAIAGGAAVVVLAIGAVLFLRQSGQPLQTEKGAAPAVPSIHLEFAVGDHRPQGRLAVTRGVRGERYSASSSLFLRFDIPTPSYVYLVGYQAGHMPLLLPGAGDPGELYAAGVHEARPDGQDGGIPLSGIQGRYVIVGVASPTPLDQATQLMPIIQQAVDPATGRIDPAPAARFREGIAIDAVYFDVQA